MEKKKIVIFTGAGFSVPAELPTGSELTRIMHKFSKKIPPCYCNN